MTKYFHLPAQKTIVSERRLPHLAPPLKDQQAQLRANYTTLAQTY